MRKITLLPAIILLFYAANLFAFQNVLLISIDTMRADHLGCYGSTTAKTPNIDGVAKNGVLFEDTVSPAPFTLPAHLSMHTGLIPPVHKVEDNGGFYVSKSTVTLAQVFKSHGMKTAAFIGGFPLDSRFGMDKGFDLYDDSYPVVSDLSELSMPERKAEEVADSALHWLNAQKSNRWFAFVHFYDAHFPYNPPERFKKLFPNDAYSGDVAYIDEQIGRLLAFLKMNHLDRNTLVVITADHGESLGEHKENTHGIFAYESTLRIPLIFSPFPQKVVKSRVRLIDVAPTILGIQKLSFASPIQGAALTNTVEGSAQPPEASSYFESLSMYFNAGWAPLRGFYSANYKYIDLPVPELYDLSNDPKEANNLCSADAKLCKDWAQRFAIFFRPYNGAQNTPSAVDAETRERLQALGYTAGSSQKQKAKFTAKDDPKTLIVFHNRVDQALGFYNRGFDDKALEILEQIIKERPDYSIAYMHASYIKASLGLPQEGAELLREALKNGVEGQDVHSKLGLYLYQADDYDGALKELKVANQEDPKDLDTLNYLGMTYTAMKDYDQAEKIFKQAIDTDPSDAMTLNNLGTLYLTQDKLDLASKQFEAAVRINEHIAAAYNGLGVVHAKQKEWDEAIKDWNLTLKENRKNYDAMINLAYAYLQNHQREQALALLQEFEKEAPPARYASDLDHVRMLIRHLQESGPNE